jgi:drug/metabolite transporter (DMT)-like permease
VVGGLLGAVLLGERLGAPFFVGGGLIVLGVLVSARQT